MTLFTFTVTKNEADRYLENTLHWAGDWLKPDHFFVYDDQSTDDTTLVARRVLLFEKSAFTVVRREDCNPSFMEHEGRFRNSAMGSFVTQCGPRDGDWVLVLDADECITCNDRLALKNTVLNLIKEFGRYDGIRFPIHTVWDHDEEKRPLYRTDGAWPTIIEPRLWKYREGAEFADIPMACRNEPTYVTKGGAIRDVDNIAILHYGYATAADRKVRFDRYTALEQHGHLPSFIESINDKSPTLKVWHGSHWGV